jgi:hypothetical protein
LEALRAAAGRRAASPATQERAAAGVLRRLLPSHALSFRFQIDPKVEARQLRIFHLTVTLPLAVLLEQNQ